MKITFSQLQFEIENERIYLLSSVGKKTAFAEIQVYGCETKHKVRIKTNEF